MAAECRDCGAALPGKAPQKRKPGTRVPAAEWVSPRVNIHALWTSAGTLAPQDLSFNLHEFLSYCDLLRRLREHFDRYDGHRFHDACLFLLRGSYGLWGYLNTSSDLRMRATVFGGLNPGTAPKAEFSSWLTNALKETTAARRDELDLLIVDEVDSGTGIGTQFNVIAAVLESWSGASVSVRITYLAAAKPDHEAEQLNRTIRKWAEPRSFENAKLEATFDLLVGTLLAYDNDDLLGIARRAQGYAAIKRTGSTIVASCPDPCHRDCALSLATAGAQVESIGTLAGAIASGRASIPVRELDATIERKGCPNCKNDWNRLRPSELPRVQVGWRSRARALCRWACRRLRRVRYPGVDRQP